TRMGITAAVLGQKLVHRLRGTRISGRPWWYRNFF
ncbi:TPA: conjugal transfer protein, partial [Escherichia coli]|nr:conjugal transfer protein [Escherichia coli]